MKTAQDYFKNVSGSFLCGFNRMIYGESYQDAFRYQNEIANRDMLFGWFTAEQMVSEGSVYFVHNFHATHSNCHGVAFKYGGSWVCNKCGRSGVDRPWWVVQVEKDGNMYCCHGEGFKNLQESDNFAFGETREIAIKNYGDLCVEKETK